MTSVNIHAGKFIRLKNGGALKYIDCVIIKRIRKYKIICGDE